ncbi:DUF3782 domain-containing protein [Pseudanabaena biceps]|nr:DUF3782 domain-containing protein [Pseudanabaena biceps]
MSQQPITIDDVYALFRTSQAELREDLRLSREEYDRRAAESKAENDRRLEKLDRAVSEASRAVNALTTRWGRFVEELVEPAVVRLFQERGIDVKEKHPRVSVTRQEIAMEIDILAVDTTDVVLVECKSKLSKDDVDEFIEKLQNFKIAFPAYKNYQAFGAVAGIEINQGVDRYAYQKGLFVIRPSGSTVEIVNDQKFQAKIW